MSSTNTGNLNQDAGMNDVDDLIKKMKIFSDALLGAGRSADELSTKGFLDLLKMSQAYKMKEKDQLDKTINSAKALKDKFDILTAQTKKSTDIINAHTAADKISSDARKALQAQNNQQKKELEEQHSENVKSHIRLRDSMKHTTDKLKMFTSFITKGVAPMAAFGMIGSKLQGAYKQKQTEGKIQNELNSLVQMIGAKSQEQLKKIEKLQKELAESKTGIGAGTANLLGNKGMSALTKMGDFASKHATGLILGAATAGLLLTVLKAAFDASPMFQQMMKLMNFGFMLILKPIGDFFGFLLRPIVILLLRKFIIPFYTTYLPFFMEWGNTIGTILADLIDSGGYLALIAVGIASLVAFFIGTKFTTMLGSKLLKLIGVGGGGASIAKTPIGGLTAVDPMAKFLGDMKLFMNNWFGKSGHIAKAMAEIAKLITEAGAKIVSGLKSIPKLISDGIAPITKEFAKIGKLFETWFKSGGIVATEFAKIGKLFETWFKSGGTIAVEIGKIGKFFTDIFGSTSPLATEIKKIVGFFSSFSTDIAKGFALVTNVIKSMLKPFGIIFKTVGEIGKIATKIFGTWVTKPIQDFAKFQMKSMKALMQPMLDLITTPASVKLIVSALAKGGKAATRFIPIIGQALAAIDGAGTALKIVNNDLYMQAHEALVGTLDKGTGNRDISKFIADILGWGEHSTGEQIGDLAKWIGDKIYGLPEEAPTNNTYLKAYQDLMSGKTADNFVASYGGTTGTNITGNMPNGQFAGYTAYANGGTITEPISGVGRSGRRYSFGENGSETVIPHGGSNGTTVNINIDKMSGSMEDVNQLRKTILNVMQQVNFNRGRI